MIKYVNFSTNQLETMIFIDESGKVQVPYNPPEGVEYLFSENKGYYSVLLVRKSDQEIFEEYVLFNSSF